MLSCFGLNICENCYLNSYKTHPHKMMKYKLLPIPQPNNINKIASGPQQGGNQKKPKSEHYHPLKYQKQINDKCKICLKIMESEPGFICGQCNIVLCLNCSNRVFYGNKQKDVHKHKLLLTFRKHWICDICRKSYEDKASFYCQPCDFDACDKCFIKY